MRLKQLDLFRAIALFFVLAHHYALPVPDLPLGLNHAIDAFFARGWISVDCFFVISGFLIAGLLFSEFKSSRDIDIKRFFIRRGFKIYPAFYVFLFCTFIVEWLIRQPSARSVLFRAFFSEFFFVQNYGPGLWVHTWSLGLEEQFYLTLPFVLCFLASVTGGLARLYQHRFWLMACALLVAPLPAVAIWWLGLAQGKVTFNLLVAAVVCWLIISWVLLMKFLTARRSDERNPFYYLPHSFFFIALLSLGLRALTVWYISPWHSKSHSFPSHLHMDALMCGVLISYFYYFHGERLRSFVQQGYKLIALGMVCLGVVQFAFSIDSSVFFQIFGFTVVYLMFGSMLLLSLYVWPERLQSNVVIRSLAYVGLHSYSIYLWHYPLLIWVFSKFLHHNLGPARYLLILIAYVLSSVVLGIVMAKLIEQPALHVREKLFPSKTKSALLVA